MEKVLSQKEQVVQMLLDAHAHLGTKYSDFQMEEYVYNRTDGAMSTTSVFVPEKLKVEVKAVSASESLLQSPPVDVMVASPMEKGPYLVLVFLHGFALSKDNYRQLFRHVTSHRCIIVAP